MSFIRKRKKGKFVYLEEVKSVRVGGKVKQVHVRYVGKEVDGKTVLSAPVDRVEVTKVSVYGPLLLLHEIVKGLGVEEILEQNAPYILSLVYAHCIDPGSVKWIEKWYARTDLNHLLGLEEVTYKKLLEALDWLEERPVTIQRKLFFSAQKKYKLDVKGLFYDVTNVYFYGHNCPMAKKGHSKEATSKKQVQIGLAVTKKEHIPLFHKVFDGNIRDVKTIKDAFLTFGYDFEKATIVWDRGITSKNNLLEAKDQGFEVICGLPLKKGAKNEAGKMVNKPSLSGIQNRVELKNATFYALQKKYSYQGIKGYLTVCLNQKSKLSKQEKRRAKLVKAIANRKKPIPPGLKKYIRYRKINEKALAEAEKFDGVSAIFSTKKLPPAETIRAYFEKDIIEKAFRNMKTKLEIRPIRHWLKERVKAHIYICYIAHYLLSILDYRLKKIGMTADQALQALETMYRVHLTDPKTKNQFTKTVTLTREQEKILKAVNKRLLKCSG